MPNWCWNNLEVMCTEEHVAELQDFVEKSTKATDEEFSFEGTLPRGDREDWYSWSLENWGTKWDACEPHVNELEPQCFSVGFETAWGPPLEWMKNIYENYPNLEFEIEYEEPGMCFGGRLKLHHDSGLHDCGDWTVESASECCEAKIYWDGDEEYTLTENDIEGPYPTDSQCSACKEECETISLPEHEIKQPEKAEIK